MSLGNHLFEARKKRGLSQEEVAGKLGVSRQTISKWEAAQSYPDFQRLVMLSDYFGMSLDELVKDLDVQDVRDRKLTDEKVASMYSDVETAKEFVKKFYKFICYFGIFVILFCVIVFVIHLIFPDIPGLCETY